jgi:hypothetical protein
MRAFGPTRLLDPGWLFVAAGLALCASAILVPARQELASLRGQVAQLAALERHAEARLAARREFIRQLDERDPALLRRLAAAQLNLMPAGATPVLAASSRRADVETWIDETVPPPPDLDSDKPSPSLLCRITSGRGRPWVLGAACLSIFFGLLMGLGREQG